MKKALIVFDWDGTLYDTSTMLGESYGRVVQEWGLPMPSDEMLRSFIGPSDRSNARRLGISDDEEVERFVRRLWETEYYVDLERGRLYPGMEDVVRALHAQGHMLCLVSNGGYNHVHAGLFKYAMLTLFEEIITMRAGLKKAESFAMLKQKFPHEQVICIGDRRGDIEAGVSIGAQTIGATYGFGSVEEFEKADAVAKDAADLSEKINEILHSY